MKKTVLLSILVIVLCVSAMAQKTKITYSKEKLLESKNNDGSFDKSITVTIHNNTFISSEIQNGIHYMVRSVPEGLTLKITRIDPSTLILSLLGTALNHETYDTASIILIWNYRAFNKKATVAYKKIDLVYR